MTAISSVLDKEIVAELLKLQGRSIEELDDLDAEVDDQVTRLQPGTQAQLRDNDRTRWEAVMAFGETRLPSKYLEASFKARVSDEHPDDRERREFEERLGLRQATTRRERNPAYAAAESAFTKLVLNHPKGGVLMADWFNLMDPGSFISQATKTGLIGTTRVEPFMALRAIQNLGCRALRTWALSEMTLDQAQEVDTYLQALNCLVPEDYQVAVTQWDRDEQEFKPVSCSYLVRQRAPIERACEGVIETTLR